MTTPVLHLQKGLSPL